VLLDSLLELDLRLRDHASVLSSALQQHLALDTCEQIARVAERRVDRLLPVVLRVDELSARGVATVDTRSEK
jgi:hypothetical protein